MNTRIAGSALAALGLGLALVPAAANAAPSRNLKFKFLEVGSNVVATATGSLDRGTGSGLSIFNYSNSDVGAVYRLQDQWALEVGAVSPGVLCTSFSGLTLISGTGMAANYFPTFFAEVGDSGSGLVSYLHAGTFGALIGMEDSYTDGAAINSTTTWLNKSFSTLGLNTGTWVYGYGSAGNTITMQIGSSAVPEPGEWAAMGVLGAGLTGLVLRKRRRA
jgi:hypothetical protein